MISFTPLIDKDSEMPVYAQIYRSIKQEITAGSLKRGERLPSIRELAGYLRISKNTASVVYQQLVAEGYASSRDRSGIYVSYESESDACPIPLNQAQFQQPVRESPANEQPIRYHFYSGPIDTRKFPVAVWKKCLTDAVHSPVKDSLGYGDYQGDFELREQIAKHLFQSRGISCSAEQIFLFSGTQQSISTLCQLLPLSGRRVAMEDPGYKGVRIVFQNHGCKIDYVPLDSDGINVESLYDSEAEAVYVTPSHQFPMGMVMPVHKRNQLLQWAINRDSFIIEDDYDSEFRYQGEPIPAMKALDYGDRVIYLGTLSKIFLPSARLCYMVLPRVLVQPFQSKLRPYNQSVSPLIQHAVYLFMKEGHFDKHIRRMKRIYQAKYHAFLAALRREMGDRVTVMGHKAGLHLILKLPEGDGTDWADKAYRGGIHIERVTDHWAGTGSIPRNEYILAFGALSEEDIEAGVKCLAEAWFPSAPDVVV